MVMSSVEISGPKYVRSWSIKYQGKERRVDQGNRGKSAQRKIWKDGLRREDAYDQVKWQEHTKAKIANPGQPG